MKVNDTLRRKKWLKARRRTNRQRTRHNFASKTLHLNADVLNNIDNIEREEKNKKRR